MRLKQGSLCLLAAAAGALAVQTACQPAQDRAPGQSQDTATASSAPAEPRRTPWVLPWNKPKPIDLVVPAGAPLRVRLDHALATNTNSPGDRFSGSLAEPVVVEGKSVIPRGARVQGVVRNSAPSGRLKGRAILSLAVDRIEWEGQSLQVQTTAFTRTSGGHKKRNWTIIGGGSGVGALIGGIASGGTGAAIGAGAGAAAGTAGAALTGKRQVRLPAEAHLSFKTRQPVTVRCIPNPSEQEPT